MADQFQYVKMPDGSYGKFLSTATPEEMRAAVESKFPDAYKTAPTPPAPEPMLKRIGEGVEDFGKGMGKGLLNTAQNIQNIIPKGSFFNAEPDINTKPSNTTQAIGKGVEQAGEFMIPGAAEEEGANAIAKIAPKLKPLARIGTAALSSGAVNKAQGGSFKQGAEIGGAGGVIGAGMNAVAPKLAETALGVRGLDRLYGRTPGRAILEDTRGIRPITVARTAQDTINSLTPEAERIADEASQRGVRGSLKPAREAVGERIGTHEANRAMDSAAELTPLQTALKTDRLTGLPLAESQTPTGLMRMKRGINSDFIGNWKPDQPPGLRTTAKQAYSALNDELHTAAPEIKDIDQRQSSLIPVAKRAEAKEVSAPFVQRLAGRVGAHTGALTGATVGGLAGYQEGGPTEAIKYGLLGLAAPEVLASPEVQMAGARAFGSKMLPRMLRAGALGTANAIEGKQEKQR